MKPLSISCFGTAVTKIVKKKKPRTRNKFEQRIEQQLRRAACSFTYESERIPYVIAGHYIPDFIVETKTGRIYLETKGHFRPEAKRKMVAVKKMHPELDIRIIFYRAYKPYIRWADKYGFKYAFHEIPKEWLEGL